MNLELELKERRKQVMKIGKRIKKVFGYVNDVDFVQFVEAKEHIIAIITSYEDRITHKQVNAVLNTYALGHWTFIESRMKTARSTYKFRNNNHVVDMNAMVSVYRVDKDTALQKLKELSG